MFYKIEDVKAEPNGILYVYYHNNITKIYNMKLLASKNSKFQKVLEDTVFSSVYVGEDGCEVAWDNEHVLSSEEIWKNGVEVLV